MPIQILRKQLDSSTLCPLCQAAMYWVDAHMNDQDLNFHECSHCAHRTDTNDMLTCHCEHCTQQRKKLVKETRFQEIRKYRQKNLEPLSLNQLTFLQKLFLLAILDEMVGEATQHAEYICWENIQYTAISPNIQFQKQLFNQLLKDNILISDQEEHFYLNVRLDGYGEPSLFSITQQLRAWFYEDLSQGTPFKHSDEVKEVLYLMLYQEVVQFAQAICRPWGIQIAGHSSLRQLCYRLLDQLAVEQIFYLVQNALTYLHKKNALEERNESFVNTHRLKKTLIQYRERAIAQRWETPCLPRPKDLRFNKMGEILYFRFFKYDERIFNQPIWHLWKKIQPRLSFYSDKRCMHCGSNDLDVEYDAESYVSLICRRCKHQDHYFTH